MPASPICRPLEDPILDGDSLWARGRLGGGVIREDACGRCPSVVRRQERGADGNVRAVSRGGDTLFCEPVVGEWGLRGQLRGTEFKGGAGNH